MFFADFTGCKTTKTGNGATYALGAAINGTFRTPAAASMPDGAVGLWCCTNGTSAREVFLGTFDETNNQVVRTQLKSSTTGSAINWGAGSKDLFLCVSFDRRAAGTTNQVTVTDNDSTGAFEISLPQDIHAGATPTFVGMTLTEGAAAATPPDGFFSLYVKADGNLYAKNDAGVEFAITGNLATNEIQRITILGNPDGGHFNLGLDGNTTGNIPFDADINDIKDFLESLMPIGTGNTNPINGPLPGLSIDVEFVAGLAGTNLDQMSKDETGLTKTAPSVSVQTITQGNPGTNEVQEFELYGTFTGGTLAITYNGETTATFAITAIAATIESRMESLSQIDDVNVTGGPPETDPVQVEYDGSQASTPVPQLDLVVSGLSGASIHADVVRLREGAPGINAGLSAYWNLNETGSNDRVDSVGGLALVASGAVTHNTSGIWPATTGNCAEFGSARTGVLTCASDPAISGGDEDFSFCFWMYWNPSDGFTSSGNVFVPIHKGLDSGDCEYSVQMSGNRERSDPEYPDHPAAGAAIEFHVKDASQSQSSAVILSGITTPQNVNGDLFPIIDVQWVFVYCEHDAVNNKIRMSLNNGVLHESDFHFGVNAGNEPLKVGHFFEGKIDELGFWRRRLTAAQRTYLMHRRLGRSHPFADASNTVQLVTIKPNSGTQDAWTFNGDASATGGSFVVEITGGPFTDISTPPIRWDATGRDILDAILLATTPQNGPGSDFGITLTDGDQADNRLCDGDDVALRIEGIHGVSTLTLLTFAVDDASLGGGSFGITHTATGSGTWPTLSGTYKLGRVGAAEETASLAVAASAAAVQVELEQLASIGDDNILVFMHGPAGWYGTCWIEWRGTLGGQDNNDLIVMTVPPTGAVNYDNREEIVGGQSPDTNELQELTMTGSPTQGSFVLIRGGSPTGDIPFDADVGDVQGALDALLGAGETSVTGGPLPTPILIEYTGSLASSSQPVPSVRNWKLWYSVTTTTEGVALTDEVQSLSIGPDITGGTCTLTFSGQTTSAIAFDADAPTVQGALIALSNLATDDVVASGGPWPDNPIVITFGNNYAGSNVGAISGNATNLDQDPLEVVITTIQNGSSGAGGGGTITPIQETPAGTINGTNDTFDLTSAPTAGTVILSVNGLVQRNHASGDYTISGTTITFNSGAIPQTGDVLIATYFV